MRKHVPSPALVVAVAALIVAMGGTAYAVSSLPPNSVGTRALKNGAVTSAKIAHHAVTTGNLSPSATVDNALHAELASTVGGQTVRKMFFLGLANTMPRAILHLAGLNILAGCDSNDNPIILADSDTNNTQLKVSAYGPSVPFSVGWSSAGGPNHGIDLTGGSGSYGAGTGTYSTSTGHVVSFNYSYDQGPTYGPNFTGCTVVGEAIGG